MFKKLILCAALSLAAADNDVVNINCGEDSTNFKFQGRFETNPLRGVAEASLLAGPGGGVVVKRASIAVKDGVVGGFSIGTDLIKILTLGEECNTYILEHALN